MTTANKITIGRILLVPFFVVQVVYYAGTGSEVYRYLALASFGVAALSDAVDGFVARRFNQRSILGAVLDPLADKLLLLSGIILLSVHGTQQLPSVPPWLTALILSRDILLTIGLAVIHFITGKFTVHARWTGKLATVLQMIVVLWALLKLHGTWLDYWCYGAGLFTGVSGVQYVLDGMRQLSAHPASQSLPDQGGDG